MAQPLLTRRFGNSIRIQLENTRKGGCTWKCVYCPNAARKTRSAPTASPKHAKIMESLASSLKKNPRVDAVVITGLFCEPTSHPEFCAIVEDILALRRKTKGKWELHCVTTGSELDRDEVRKVLDSVDHAWIKLDCATDRLFTEANLPEAEVGTLKDHLTRIRRLKSLKIQTTLWKFRDHFEQQNWSPDNLRGLLELYEELRPQAVHLATLKSQTVFSDLQPVPHSDLEAFALRVEELGVPVTF